MEHNTTLISVYQVGLIRVEMWALVLAGMSICLIVVSFWLIGIISDYLMSKPPGQVSPVDKPTILFLQSLKLLAVLGQLFLALKELFWKVNEIPAKILMWPFYNSVDVVIFSSVYVAIIHHTLLIKPEMMGMNEDLATLVFVGYVTAFVLITDGCFHYYGIYPPSYYMMTNQPGADSNKLFMLRRILFASSVVIILTLKMWGWWLNRNSSERGKSNTVLSDKAILALLGKIAIIILVRLVCGMEESIIVHIGIFTITVLFPLAIICFNDKIRGRVVRKLKHLVKSQPNQIEPISLA